MNFILDYQNQLEKLAALTCNKDNEKQVKEIIDKAGIYLYKYFSYNSDKEVINCQKLLEIAYYLNDMNMAMPLIDHFKLTKIKKDHIDIISKLQERYGVDYCLQFMNKWKNNLKESYFNNNILIENIDQLIERLSKKECDIRLASFLLQYQLDGIIKYYQNLETPRDFRISKTKRLSYIEGIFKSLQFFYVDKIAQKLVAYLIKNTVLYPHIDLAKMVCPLYRSKTSKSTYDTLCNHLIQSIEKKLKKGLRKNNDWSIEKKLFCNCEYCREVNYFLSSNYEQKTWSIIKNIRKHIIDQFNVMDLPVKLEELKKGSPHKLIITKTQDLHTHANNNFKKLQECYYELTEIMLVKDNGGAL